MPRRFHAAIVLTLAALALAGCVKMDTRLTIGADDTVDGSAVIAVDKSLLTLAGRDPKAAFERAERGLDRLPEGTRVEPYDDQQFYGKKIIFVDVPLSEFSAGQAGTPQLTHADGLYTFELNLDPDQFGRLGVDARMLRPVLNSLRIHVEITFPGKVIESNGTLNGQTVTWDVRVGVDTRLRAVSEEPSSVPEWAMFAAAGGLLALLVVGAIVALALRLRGEPAVAGSVGVSDALAPIAGTPTAVTPAVGIPTQTSGTADRLAQTSPTADGPTEPSH